MRTHLSAKKCCGQLFSSCRYDLDIDCGGDIKHRFGSVVEKRIEEISRTNAVLVADCKGRYSAYATLSALPRPKDSIDDKVLR